MTDGGFSLDKLNVLRYDDTITKTCWGTAVIHLIEQEIKRPLQEVVCLLHFNKLPFRHLFQTLDNETTGVKSF